MTLPPADSPTLFEMVSRAEAVPVDRVHAALLRASVPPFKRPAFALFCRLWPKAFEVDQQVIAAAGKARSMAEVREIVRDMRRHQNSAGTFLRRTLGIRVSGKRLLARAVALLPAEDPQPGFANLS